MRRPQSIASTTTAGMPITLWKTDNYVYDGAGNITQIGAARFLYDPVSRLTSGSLVLGPQDNGAAASQTYTFDAFGNIQTIGGNIIHNTPTNSATNRLNSPGITYDPAGNLTTWNGASYEYDDLNQLKHYISGNEEWLYMYDADDERLWSFKPGRFDRWTIRDLAGKVLRTYEATNYNWTASDVEDDIYRDGLLLAAELPNDPLNSPRHFHLDHLGTPRLITNRNGAQTAYHVYYPFGEEATPFNQDTERMKFTGHERDLASVAGSGDDLDYMHARHCSPVTGRFLSVDVDRARPNLPQSWNRYIYTRDNPLRFFDPNGREVVDLIYRAFIPQDHVGIFQGDARGFSSAKNASSRTSIHMRVETDQTKRGSANPLLVPADVKIGSSHTIFSSSSRTSTGPLLPFAAAYYDSKGNVVVGIQQDSKIPYPGPTSGIRTDMTVMISSDAAQISFRGTESGSPSFEAVASVNGGPAQDIPLQSAATNPLLFYFNLQTDVDLNLTVPLQRQPQ